MSTPVSAEVSTVVVSDDLTIVRVSVGTNEIISQSIVGVRSQLRRYRLETLKSSEGMTVVDAARRRQAHAAVNANFFSPDGSPLGIVASRGSILNPLHQGGSLLTGVFQVTRTGPSIVHRTAFDPKRAVEAVQGGPRLLDRGVPVAGFEQRMERAARAGVCIDARNQVTLFATSAELGGFTFLELQRALREHPFDCRSALAFDGGSSTQLAVFKGTAVALSMGSSTRVPVILSFVPR